MSTPFPYRAGTAVSLALLLALAACGDGGGRKKDGQAYLRPVEAQTENGKIDMLLPDFTRLMEQEGATVVNIQAYNNKDKGGDKAKDDLDRSLDEDPFRDFFKRLVPEIPSIQNPEEGEDEEDDNLGSGFIISPDGYILTNTHVVSATTDIKVTLNDKREFSARLVGSDPQTDIALLKIDANGLQTVRIGDAKKLKAGEWVAAIGAPFGFENSITSGIVSAKGRSLPNENYTPFIQTDVAVNPGNSGGPLFNLNGEVVGINSQIYSRSGGFMGISFAIPIDVAMNVSEQLKTTGKVQRGRLGVIIQEVDYRLAQSFGLAKPAGALISEVIPEGPAAKSGLLAGDVVLKVNGEDVRSSNELPVMVGWTMPGKEVTLTVWRDGKTLEQKILLDSADKNSGNTEKDDKKEEGGKGGKPQNRSFSIAKTGLTLTEQTEKDTKRLVVSRAEGTAARAGIKKGDAILAVGNREVGDEKTLNDALKTAADGSHVPLLVQRQGHRLFVALKIECARPQDCGT
ncbi:MAG: DegQ family serine endoprotease [Neisseria sp.]|nr:DegQ family serine endoprotease [Neisseria sp.]